jgi:hypothetical protein
VSPYDIIADLRREQPTRAATETLDMVVAELGRSRDNLKSAIAALSAASLPQGAKAVLDELAQRARAAGVDDLDYGTDPFDPLPAEPLDDATAGIGALLAITTLAGLALAVVAAISGLNAIFSASHG